MRVAGKKVSKKNPGGSVLRKEPSQKRSRENIERMLAAAAAVLEEEGYDALKTVTIAKRAGASVGSVYQYFPDKYAILSVLVDRWVAADNLALEQVESQRERYASVVDEFVDLARHLVRSYKEQRALLAIVNLIRNIPELYERVEKHDKKFARRLAKIIERHGLKADPAEKLALAGYFTIIVDAAALSIATETPKRAKLKEKFLLSSVTDIFSRYL